MPHATDHLCSRHVLVKRACLGWLAGVSVMLLGACATGLGGTGASGGSGGAGGAAGAKTPDAVARAIGPSVLMRCGKQEVNVRANAEQAELTVGSKRYLLQAQRSASGARYAGLPRDLTVREWVVQSMDGRGVIDNSRTTLTFDPKGQIAGRAGCNRYTGAYQAQGARLEVKGVATTRMICVPALMDQEARFLALLGQVVSFQLLRDGSLELRTQDQRRILAR